MRPILASLFVLVLAGPASAEEPPVPPAEPPAPSPSEGERVVLPAKRLYARATLDLDLSSESAFDPVSLSPDVFYGVTPALTVGLIHSFLGSLGFMGRAGSSLCLAGDKCDGIYNGVGVDGRYHIAGGKVAAAANFGLFVDDFDPFRLVVKLGVIGRFRPKPASKLAVDFAPALFIGLTEREPAMMGGAGNKEVLAVPATVLYAATPQITAMVQTGLFLPFEAAGQLYFVPLTLGASYEVNKQISATASFSLMHLLGGDALPTGFDGRSFTIGGGYAF
jgi:hypothetical protein